MQTAKPPVSDLHVQVKRFLLVGLPVSGASHTPSRQTWLCGAFTVISLVPTFATYRKLMR